MGADGFRDGDREIKFRRSLPPHLAKAIREGRRGVSWTRVSQFSGISVSMLKDVAAGKRVPSARTLDRLEAAGFKLAAEVWAELRELAP